MSDHHPEGDAYPEKADRQDDGFADEGFADEGEADEGFADDGFARGANPDGDAANEAEADAVGEDQGEAPFQDNMDGSFQMPEFGFGTMPAQENRRHSKRHSVAAGDAGHAERERHKAANRALPLQYVEKNIAERIAMDGFYTDFFVYIPFVILFMIFFLNGRNIETNHMAARASKEMYFGTEFPQTDTLRTALDSQGPTSSPVLPMDRYFAEIDRAEHWHTWFRDVLVPNTWDCAEPDYSRTTLYTRGQMQYLGGMRLRVLTVRNDSCDIPTHGVDNEKDLPRTCFSTFSFSGSKTSTRPRCGQQVNPALPSETMWSFVDSSSSLRTTGQESSYPSDGYTVTLPFNATCNQVRAMHDIMKSSEDCNIINNKDTRFVISEWFQYGANTDQYMMNKLFFEVTASGAWVVNHQVRMFPVWTSKRLLMSMFDMFFFIFVLYFVYRLAYDWIMYYRVQHKILSFCLDTWNLLEIVNITTLLAVSILRWTWWTKSQNAKKEFPFPFAYPEDLDGLVLVFSSMIYANSVNVIITVLKVLKYFQLNNRLNILTRTLSVSQQGIIGVLALFLFLVTGYAMCGTALYGTNLRAFKNINTSFSSLAFLLLGQFDYPAMRAVQPWLTAVYFFSFVIVCNFLLLNFIIAILSDGFAQVNSNTALEPLDETVLRQIYLLRENLTFRNLKKLIELRKKGKTRQLLLHSVHKYLSEHVDMLAKQNPELLHNDVPMYRTDLKHWLPEQLYMDLGDHYIELLWEDMAHDYHLHCLGGTHQMRKEIQSAITEAVTMTVSEDRILRPIAAAGECLDAVDRVVDKLTADAEENYDFNAGTADYGGGEPPAAAAAPEAEAAPVPMSAQDAVY